MRRVNVQVFWSGDTVKMVVVTNGDAGFFTSYEKNGRFITFYGDAHPVYAGNVVKAMGGATQGYPVVSRMLARDLLKVSVLYLPLLFTALMICAIAK